MRHASVLHTAPQQLQEQGNDLLTCCAPPGSHFKAPLSQLSLGGTAAVTDPSQAGPHRGPAGRCQPHR